MNDRVNNPIKECAGPCDIVIMIVYYNQPITIPINAVASQIPFDGIDIKESMKKTFTNLNSKPPLSILEFNSIGPKVLGLGHAGISFINGKTGDVEYYEYGRYDAENFGEVRDTDTVSQKLPALSGMKIQFGEDGNPTQKSFNYLISNLTRTNKGPYEYEAVYIKLSNGAFDIMKNFSDKRLKDVQSRIAKIYNVANNHCFTFVMEVADEVGINTDVSSAQSLTINLVGGNILTRNIVYSMAPTFEVPSRQMRALQNRYQALNVSNKGILINDFKFPKNINSK